MTTRWNVGSQIAAWSRIRTLVFLTEGMARDVDPSSSGRRGPESASVTPLLFIIFYMCHDGKEVRQHWGWGPDQWWTFPLPLLLPSYRLAKGQELPLESVTLTRLGLVCSGQKLTSVGSSLDLVLFFGDRPEFTKTYSILGKALG